MYSHFVMIVDCLLAFFLLFTMIYLSKINKDIKNIRFYQKNLTDFSDHFSEAIKRSEHTLKKLHTQKDDLDKNLHTAIQHTETLLDDLKYATERAENAFQKLSQASSISALSSTDDARELQDHSDRYDPIRPTHSKRAEKTTDMHHMVQTKRKEALRKVLSKLR